MKIFKYILIFGVMVTAIACDRGDDTSLKVELPEGPTFDVSTLEGARMKAFYDEYGVWCQYNVPALDLYYAWTTSDNWTTSSLDYEYEEADPDYIIKGIDFLEDEVMSGFPREVIDAYMELCIAFEGRIFHSCELEDYLNYSSIEDYPGISLEYEDADYGWNSSRYLLLAPVGSDFDKTDKDLLKRKWTSWIFCKAMQNLPNPDAFEKNNEDAWSAWWYYYDEYLVGDNKKSGWLSGYSPYDDGLVSSGPILFATLEDGYDDEDNETGFYGKISKAYDGSSCLSAFAEYVAYIMYATPEEKEEIRSYNDNILVNEGLVKEYCKKNLNWDIPELGE